MKKIIATFSALLAVATACQKHYELNTSFTMPTSLSSPSSVVLDVTSTATVELSWTGGGAAAGGIVLYEVLFDRAGGNFSEPLTVMPSDLGAGQTLTLSHATLNTIARKAGVAPNQSGSFIWTVRGSRGGVSKVFDGYETLNVTRGEGIDNMPERLYVAGSAAKEAGQEFRVVEEGLYSIVTRLGAGSLRFTSEKGGGLVFHASAAGKLVEGEGDYTVQEAPATGLARITVNFNTLSLKVESVEAQLHAAWEATGVDFAVLEYEGNGVFSGEGEAVFYGPGRDGTPSWCSWVEERYSFLVEIDGVQKRWGSSFGGNSFTPDGTESFYYIYEFDKADWDALWKMDHALDLKNVRVTVWTNKDNHFTHMVEEAGPIVYDQPTSTPAELFLTGAAAETDGQAFRKDGDKFVAYAKLNAGALSFVDGEGVKYFIQNDNDLYIGKRSYDVAAFESVTRVTVDFSTNKVTFDEIGTDVRMIWGCNYETVIALSYQGGGKFAGEGRVVFVDASRPETNPPGWLGWTEERYYFIATVNGEEVCWGRLDGEDAENRPDGEVSATFYDIGEFAWSQWDHLWKMGSIFDNSNVSAVINTNDEGHFKHSFTKQSDQAERGSVPADRGSFRADPERFRRRGRGPGLPQGGRRRVRPLRPPEGWQHLLPGRRQELLLRCGEGSPPGRRRGCVHGFRRGRRDQAHRQLQGPHRQGRVHRQGPDDLGLLLRRHRHDVLRGRRCLERQRQVRVRPAGRSALQLAQLGGGALLLHRDCRWQREHLLGPPGQRRRREPPGWRSLPDLL